MLYFFKKKTKISTNKMKLSRVIIIYLIFWKKLALNGARMMKIGYGGKNSKLGSLENVGNVFMFC